MSWTGASTVVAAVAFALTGCGGSGEDAAPPTGPRLPRVVASDLAARSDRVSARLTSGDTCAADREADALRTRAVEVVSEVPPALQEELLSGVNALAERISCPAPAPVPKPSGGDGERGEQGGKGKGEKEEEDDEGDGDD